MHILYFYRLQSTFVSFDKTQLDEKLGQEKKLSPKRERKEIQGKFENDPVAYAKTTEKGYEPYLREKEKKLSKVHQFQKKQKIKKEVALANKISIESQQKSLN